MPSEQALGRNNLEIALAQAHEDGVTASELWQVGQDAIGLLKSDLLAMLQQAIGSIQRETAGGVATIIVKRDEALDIIQDKLDALDTLKNFQQGVDSFIDHIRRLGFNPFE